METNQIDMEQQELNAQVEETVKPEKGKLDEQDKIIVVVSNVLLILGCILSVAVFCIGFYCWNKFDLTVALAPFLFGIVGVFITLVQWLYLRIGSKILRKLNVLEKKLNELQK